MDEVKIELSLENDLSRFYYTAEGGLVKPCKKCPPPSTEILISKQIKFGTTISYPGEISVEIIVDKINGKLITVIRNK